MDEKLLGEELRAMSGPARPGPNCLDEYQLAALTAGELESNEYDRFEQHLSECRFCLDRVTDLAAIPAGANDDTVSEVTLHRARALSRRRPGMPRVARWATAAVVVLALGVVLVNTTDQSGIEPLAPATTDEFRQSRSVGELQVRPTIIQPTDGSHLSLAQAEIQWTSVPGSLYYDVRVVSSAGELVGQERVGQNHWNVPDGLLQPGTEYYVRVDAYVAEAKRLSSQHVLFTVEPR